MADAKIRDHKTGEPIIKLFGIPIIQSKCQGDSLYYGILGGFAGGLISYLFTSRATKSMHIGMGCYVVTTLCYATYCMQEFREMQKQRRLLQSAMYEASLRGPAEHNNVISFKPEDV